MTETTASPESQNLPRSDPAKMKDTIGKLKTTKNVSKITLIEKVKYYRIQLNSYLPKE